ncbi:MAG: hypothetical protein B0A82_25410 [Alkalinema sp. CACIAM 70d]|nr:MAG: hypothetical protein B0A82_25410 [Alkalinema sp. CACIAM 70d]
MISIADPVDELGDSIKSPQQLPGDRKGEIKLARGSILNDRCSFQRSLATVGCLANAPYGLGDANSAKFIEALHTASC